MAAILMVLLQHLHSSIITSYFVRELLHLLKLLQSLGLCNKSVVPPHPCIVVCNRQILSSSHQTDRKLKVVVIAVVFLSALILLSGYLLVWVLC